MLLLLAACGVTHELGTGHPPDWPCSNCAPPLEPDPRAVVDRFPQHAADETDVLVALDPAAADAVVAALPLLAESLDETGTDWRIGLVSTADGSGLPIGGWIGPDDPLPDSLVVEGEVADPLEATALAFTAAGIRPDAAVHVLFVVRADATGDVEAWTLVWSELRLPWDRSVAVVAPADATVLRGLVTGDEPVGAPSEVEEVVVTAGQVAAGLARTFSLSRPPDPDSLEVRVWDVSGAVLDFDLPDDVSYEPASNAVRFHQYWPNPGAVIEVSYLDVQPSTD